MAALFCVANATGFFPTIPTESPSHKRARMTQVLIDGLSFGEGPRWRDGALWLAEMHDQRVLKVTPDGTATTIVTIDDDTSGLGWMPNGDLLVVSMRKRQLLRFDGQNVHVHADLSRHASSHCNDMVVDATGRAYVGNFGFDLFSPDVQPRPAEIIRVEPDGAVLVEDDETMFPNGMVITPDGGTLIVGESFGNRLTAYDIGNDGGLTNKRLWADLPQTGPDGICLDDQGGVWVASPMARACVRVAEGGEITHRIETDRSAIACTIGGDSLYLITAASMAPEQARANRDARVEVHPAPFASGGSP